MKFYAMVFIWALIWGPSLAQQTSSYDKLTYHSDSERSGWNPHETRLTPETVSGSRFTQLWQTPEFDQVDGDEPRLFASPLYVDRLTMSKGPYKGKTFSVVFAATDVGYVYAVNASAVGNIKPEQFFGNSAYRNQSRIVLAISAPLSSTSRDSVFT